MGITHCLMLIVENVILSAPGIMSALELAWMEPLSFSQLKVGGGKPVASQERDTKLFTTTVTLSGLTPMIVGGTERKNTRNI